MYNSNNYLYFKIVVTNRKGKNMSSIKNIFLLSFMSFALSGTVTELYKVEGMHCQYGCANKVKSLVSEMDGMKKCEVDFETSLMTVEFDDEKVNSDLILSLVADKTTYKYEKITEEVEKKSFWNRLKKLFG